jgi:hypothetical protein
MTQSTVDDQEPAVSRQPNERYGWSRTGLRLGPGPVQDHLWPFQTLAVQDTKRSL